MAFGTRMWGVGRALLLAGALVATYLIFAAVSAKIALRAREVSVPDLTARLPGAAGALVSEYGLTLRVDPARRGDPRVPVGHIVAQEPAAGSAARRGRSVRVWLSAGHEIAQLPDLIGESERSAVLRVRQSGVDQPVLSELHTADWPAGAVIAQEPAPGEPASRVALLLNRGDRPRGYLMPDLIGLPGDRAADVLRSARFRVAVVGQQPYPGVPAGIVIRQTPPAGLQITADRAISLEVSR